ncbi:hypothetical protein ET445_00100 [Agromyces protaetiae]|uniref:DUF7507 domain-containing protein n=1 Tax=Agromyces protaetiae TaxID=2509455 RepID=A0A4P6FN72_9MICO|nr:hypothetical protein [Agromyces protaetiae]QAY71968.1 hypothetical protein ET445_00100 [Agromyces protaetiae]
MGEHRRATARTIVAAGIAVLAISAGTTAIPMLPVSPASAQATGPIFVDETFIDASAPDFLAYGSACLTGAPTVAALEPGDHELTGCPVEGTSPGGVGPVPPRGDPAFGYLQLTDNALDQAGAVLFDSAIPSTTGVETTFEIWQYGSTTDFPADGISFFLVDGEVDLEAPGAFGGSLGYAQSDDGGPTINPGVAGGYLGIGFDTLGNFFGDWEQRGNGCPPEGQSPAGTAINPAVAGQRVTVRGPGDGTTGYCFLTSTTSNFTTTPPWPTTLPAPLQGDFAGFTTIPPTPASAEADLVSSRRTVTIVITPAPDPVVTISMDFEDSAGNVEVLSFPAPPDVPATYKFGFAASTGDWNNVHLLRHVRVQALDPLPALSLVKRVGLDPATVEGEVGKLVPYAFEVTNTGGTLLDGVVVDDPKIGVITCPATTLAPGESTVCTGQYALTQADLDAGEVLNTAIARGTGPAGEVESNPSEARVEITRPILAESGSAPVVPLALGLALLALGGWALASARARREQFRKSSRTPE